MRFEAQPRERPSSPLTNVDQLLRQRAQETPNQPLVAYPKSDSGLTDFELISVENVNRFTDNAARTLLSDGLEPTNGVVVALLGLSTLDYMIAMLALSRLGCAVLLLSPRLAVDAYISLLEKTKCKIVVYAQASSSISEKIGLKAAVRRFKIPPPCLYDHLDNDSNGTAGVHRPSTPGDIAFILHSSGSTGYPKPIFQMHQACLANYSFGTRSKAFSAVPLFHQFGHANFYRTLFHGGTIYMFNPYLPLTSDNLASVLEMVQPEVMVSVPYLLKLLAESRRGIAALVPLKTVLSAGSAIPNEIGELLVKEGVNIVTIYGTTETGLIMSSNRPKDDTAWDYMRLLPSMKPYVRMIPISEDVREAVVLDGAKSKVTSNSNDPPNSFHTRDLFTSHPTIPDGWKYLGRLDDRVTLVNGEKVLPIPIEGRIRQDPAVREAVVFGIDRDVPGLLVFRSSKAQDLSDEEFIMTIWPAVEDANSRAEGFSQISKNAIIPMPSDAEYPQTDKGTIIRAQVYRVFADRIQNLYEQLQGSCEGILRLTEPQLQKFLISIFKNNLGITLESPLTDFFSSGLDSLKAIHLASSIKKEFYLGGCSKKVNQNSVYVYQNVARLAKFLYNLQSGLTETPDTESDAEDLALMTTLINRYSKAFPNHTSGNLPSTPDQQLILLTGATGSLGAHILAQLLPLPHIKHVYCPIRSSSSEISPLARLLTSLSARRITVNHSTLSSKVTCFLTTTPTIAIPDPIVTALRTHTSTIIHAAWPVNFTLPLASFELHIAGTRSLIDFAISSHTVQPMRFVFCSSVSVALGAPEGTVIGEEAVPVGAVALRQGYARGKGVVEHILQRAGTPDVHDATKRDRGERDSTRSRVDGGFDVRVLRIGQIAGDTVHGVWNTTEAVPLMIQSVRAVRALPRLDEWCSWVPVNECAGVLIELSGLADSGQHALEEAKEHLGEHKESGGWKTMATKPVGTQFFNVRHPIPFHFTHHLLPLLHSSPLLPPFHNVTPKEWLACLEQCAEKDPSPVRNPWLKLIGFWRGKYSGDGDGDGAGTEGGRLKDVNEERKGTEFSIENTTKQSPTLKGMEGYLESGSMEKVLKRWASVWDKDVEDGEKQKR